MKHPIGGNVEIPDKKYFRIGEVSQLVGVDTHVLRFWESEFSNVKPRRARSNQRLYRRQDVENLLTIKTLLHDQGYTIAGARRVLQEHKKSNPPTITAGEKKSTPLQNIKEELKDIKKILSK